MLMSLAVAGCDAEPEPEAGPARQPTSAPPADPWLHPVLVNQPAGPPRIETGRVDAHGHEVTVSCATCHDVLEPNPAVSRGQQLTEFHLDLEMAHGELTCVSCHNPGNYDQLRLADGRSLEFVNVMELCGQCHGSQRRDFEQGAHGGMTGYWDRTRGPRQRHSCIDCHEPHAPAFPQMKPVFPPRDGLPPGTQPQP